MPYYCTVPQCTSLAGKAKNVSFHQFPRDERLGQRWNEVLRRDKPYTKYSKVCSLHFTADDYTMTHMGKNKGQWKTLNKDAIPSQNLPRLNADGTLMVLRKSRSPKYASEDHSTQSHPHEPNEAPSIFTLAKEYLSNRSDCKEEWFQNNGDEMRQEEGLHHNVKIKEEFPEDETRKKKNKKRPKVQTVDATIQTDLCQEGIGFRKSLLDSCPNFPSFFPQPDTAGMTNYFQTNANEPLSLPKDPLHQAESAMPFTSDFRRIFLDQLDQTRRKGFKLDRNNDLHRDSSD